MNADKSELLYGAKAIASHLNLTRRQVYWLIEKATLPAFRMPNTTTVCACRSTLTQWVAEQELKGLSALPPKTKPRKAPGTEAKAETPAAALS
jgi:hypothetical protein